MARDQFIKFRATPEERAQAEASAKARETTLSELLRAYLQRLAKQDKRTGK